MVAAQIANKPDKTLDTTLPELLLLLLNKVHRLPSDNSRLPNGLLLLHQRAILKSQSPRPPLLARHRCALLAAKTEIDNLHQMHDINPKGKLLAMNLRPSRKLMA
jgi:hypothetical protein